MALSRHSAHGHPARVVLIPSGVHLGRQCAHAGQRRDPDLAPVVAATFWLAWKAYGRSVAGWAILPLVFSSTGTIWLSGRITGGHLLTLAWHTLAFVGLHACLTRGGRLRAAGLGLWCGLGLYLDAMFLFTLFGLAPAAPVGWFFGGRWRLKLCTAAAFVVGGIFGFLPHEIGRVVDPYDAYPSQFIATFEEPAVREHGRLLALQCLPRLIAGTELDRFDRIGRRHESHLRQADRMLARGSFQRSRNCRRSRNGWRSFS